MFFSRFKIRDLESATTLFEIAKPAAGEAGEEAGEAGEEEGGEDGDQDPNAGRFVRYHFTSQVYNRI